MLLENFKWNEKKHSIIAYFNQILYLCAMIVVRLLIETDMH